MIEYRGVEIFFENGYIGTRGLFKMIEKEFIISIKKRLQDEYVELIRYLINYVIDSKPLIKPDQTIAYHSWLLKCCEISDLNYEIWEVKSNGEGFEEGADYAIKVVQEQKQECKKYEATPIFPIFNQMIAISKGVYEGLAVDAVRYPSPDHMSGWWLTTDLYDENIESLMSVHYYHVAFMRPELIKYLALPYGYRFYKTDNEQDIWFDKDALK
ncbi:immunity protein Imm33 domain-containing protein [Paenibacillus sp. MMO-58]|uniref:immunity protein Imm33 domain-containing protein n=1 Tax=Paenibacillus sp. MMO-58 TaxID=3081290 RepID=UPI003018E977